MYKNNINKKLNNTQLVYSTINKNNVDIAPPRKKEKNISIEKKINDIFNSYDYVYKADVNIVTYNEVIKKRIVARNRNYLITYDNEYIPISIIKDIYK